ncbi:MULTISPECIES: 6-carboxytetrahydropterin synthase [unclassified Vibrio]|uniref:6-carboxy-5,6,7,8-tetrahydropterin synthase n=1 Tax=Vibrio sp. HB236076 TaxID=3232307 RepID=A0AB39HJA6_9VIBR|nr:6-carboxytetrahydropterin synthase [Vibrio sp. HB161653]MDP5255027.1 6-carboxytetrahydropterin synthase [Vibrio sp. HB161653]
MNLFVRDLTVIDMSFYCPQRGIVGDSWIVDVSLSGQLNEMSMVLDFGRVKKQIKQLIDQCVDHRLLIPTQQQSVVYRPTSDGYAQLHLLRSDKSIYLHCPEEAYCLIDSDEVTLSSVVEHLNNLLLQHLPSNVTGLELTLRPEAISGAYYHYTHGLKKHDGNCQRIAHGHRSPIEILVNGQRNTQIEQSFAQRWHDIYLATQEDQVTLGDLSFAHDLQDISDETHYGFKYQAPQGEFEIAIAKSESEVLPTDTTVELLANFIADEVKKKLSPSETLQVIAYEGVGKGAMAFR